MAEKIEPMFPTRKEVELKLIDLLDSRVERGEAAGWAKSIVADRSEGADPPTLETLKSLARVDAKEPEYHDYLFDTEAIRGWLESLRAAPPEIFPARVDVEQKLLGLLEGKVKREYVTAWAGRLLERAEDVHVTDSGAWSALSSLAMCDGKQPDGSYMYTKASFRSWLEQLRAAPSPSKK